MCSDMIPSRHRHEEASLFDYCIAKGYQRRTLRHKTCMLLGHGASFCMNRQITGGILWILYFV